MNCYKPDDITAYKSYPFGSEMPNRSFSSGEYRYGFQGSEVDGEIQSDRNHINTYFREGNLETGQWWRLDPKPSAGVSPYAMFNRNPVLYNDVLGDTIRFGQGVGLLFKIKTQIVFATASLFSKEARSAIKELKESPHTTEIRKTSGMSRVIEADFEDWRDSDPILTGQAEPGNSNNDNLFDQWMASKPTHNNAENGIGTDSRMYLNLSNLFRKGLKAGKYGGLKSSLIQATTHEVGHARNISTGTAEFKMVNQTEVIFNVNRSKWEIHHYKINQEELNAVNFENKVTKELNKSILFNKTIRKSYFGN